MVTSPMESLDFIFTGKKLGVCGSFEEAFLQTGRAHVEFCGSSLRTRLMVRNCGGVSRAIAFERSTKRNPACSLRLPGMTLSCISSLRGVRVSWPFLACNLYRLMVIESRSLLFKHKNELYSCKGRLTLVQWVPFGRLSVF